MEDIVKCGKCFSGFWKGSKCSFCNRVKTEQKKYVSERIEILMQMVQDEVNPLLEKLCADTVAGSKTNALTRKYRIPIWLASIVYNLNRQL